ncbi:MAG: glycosyltransferase 61 family protein, partial [Candidatus Paceibacteria bacterium]
SEQVNLFHKAETIVAPHGAGLTHLIFAQDPTVLELFPANNIPFHYFCISQIFNHEYRFLIGDQVDTDMYIDPNNFRESLSLILQES